MSIERWRSLIDGSARGPKAALQRLGLAIVGAFFSPVVRLRNRLYDWGVLRAKRLPVPVISVGNLTVGGTGKTPFVELVCRRLLALNRKPVILIRGYKAGAGGSDEAKLLAERLPEVPVVIDADRIRGGRRAIDEHDAEVLVLDDGFQHRRLHRDLDIVLVDSANPWGFGRLLPGGLLREPIRGLGRAGLVVRTNCPFGDDELRHPGPPYPQRPILRTRHAITDLLRFDGSDDKGRPEPAETIRAGEVFAFAGIGSPTNFFRGLLDWGCKVSAWRVFPDHHEFTDDDLTALLRDRPAGAVLVTTEKDLQRLSAQDRKRLAPLAVVRMEMRILSGERALDDALAALFPIRLKC